MRAPRQLALHAYYYSSLPLRAWSRRRWGAPVCVLFYHRVADHAPNQWTIPTARFLRHMRWLRRHFEIVTLAEAQARIASERNDAPSVAITFDDGYADNCQTALPWLLRHGIPFTYFVSSQFVLEQRPFQHDVAAGVPLAPNTAEQVRALADAGVEIGGHTRAHADLGQLDDQQRLHDEVVGGAADLERLTGRPVRYFAFPYGLHENLHPSVFAIAKRQGWLGVCSAYGGYNCAGDDPFHLQRIHGDAQTIRLKNWLTLDPRKWLTERRYQPGGWSPPQPSTTA